MSTVDVRSKYLIEMVMAIEWQTVKTNYKKKLKEKTDFIWQKKKKKYILYNHLYIHSSIR